MVKVIEVESKKQRKDFFKFPLSLYKGNEYIVPPLISDEDDEFNPKKNGAYEFCESRMFLAYDEKGKVVGRIAGIINHAYNGKQGVKQMRFTRFDIIDDFAVTQALFEPIFAWAKEKGLNEIIGPIGFSDFDKQGMLIDGFDQMSMFITIYNFPYYVEHMEKMGFTKGVDWVEYRLTVPDQVPERIKKLADKIAERYGFSFREIKGFKSAEKEIHEVIRTILNEAFSHLYGVTKFNERQIKREADMLKQVWVDDFGILVKDKDGKFVGYGFMAPSTSKALRKFNGKMNLGGIIQLIRDVSNPEVVDLYSIGVLDDYRNSGVNVMILARGLEMLIKHKVKYLETGPELETNTQVQSQWKFFEKTQHKRRRCWSLKLD